MKTTLFAILLIMIVMIACQPAVNNPAPTPVPTAPVVKTPEEETKTALETKPSSRTQDANIVKLFEKNSLVKSYSFTISELPDMRGGSHYYVRGTKIKVEPIQALVREGDLDVIFLDSVTKTAAAYCIDSTGCDTPNDAIPQSYDDWDVVLPTEWIEQAKYGKKTGSLTFYNKPVTVIEYEAEGKYYQVYLDNYFGFPQRVAIATDAGMENIVGGYEYRQMAFNTIKESDVIHIDE